MHVLLCAKIQEQMSFTTYQDARRLTDGTMEYHFVGQINHRYQVFEEGWHNVDIQTCADESIYLRSILSGDVHFKNPYGYVPAEQWGIIPFEVNMSHVGWLLGAGCCALCVWGLLWSSVAMTMGSGCICAGLG